MASKKKTSTQDFLNLLDEETPAAAPMAFNPKKKKAPAAKVVVEKAAAPKRETRKLSTKEKILLELIDLAKKKSPRIVSDLITTWLPTDFGKTRKSARR